MCDMYSYTEEQVEETVREAVRKTELTFGGTVKRLKDNITELETEVEHLALPECGDGLSFAIHNIDADDETLAAVENDDPALPIDMYLFRESQAEGYALVTERRKKYGSHVANHKRFPLEHWAGKYIKCCRMVRMIEACVDVDALNATVDDDTLLDDACYDHIIRSARKAT